MEARRFRDLLGSFATGVTVITTNVDGMLHGMTANAISSVSLEPLLLLVCVDRRAHCHTQIVRGGAFGVNILGAGQRDLSEVFARSEEPEAERLRGAPHHLGELGVPILEGVLGHVECRLVDVHPGGDHDIFVGEAIAGEISLEGEPLLFYRGKYRVLA